MTPTHHRIAVAFVFAVAAILYTISIGRIGYEGKDERRYAQVSKEIGSGPRLFVMYYQGELYPDKPPLYFWSCAALFKLTGGVSPLASRLPLAASGLLSLGFIYLMARRLYGARAALIAVVLCLLCFRIFWGSRWARLDVPMAAFVMGAMWASTRLLFPLPGERAPSLLDRMLPWFFAGVSVLAKGPGALIWLGGIASFALASAYAATPAAQSFFARLKGALRNFAPGREVLAAHRFSLGPLVLLAVVCVWFVPAAYYGGREYLGPMIGVHVVDRAFGVVRHVEPFYYFWHKILYDSMPIGPFLIPALLWWWREERHGGDSARACRFAIAWLAFCMVFFTLPAGKRTFYMIPVYPAAGLLVARFLDRAIEDSEGFAARLARPVAWFITVLLLILGCLAPWLDMPLRGYPVPIDPAMRWVLLVTFVALGGFGVRALSQKRLATALATSAACLAIAFGLLFGSFFPANRNNDIERSIAAALDKAHTPDAEAAIFGLGDGDRFTLYGRVQPRYLDWIAEQRENARRAALAKQGVKVAKRDKQFTPEMELDGWLQRPGRRLLIVSADKWREYVPSFGTIAVHELGRWQDAEEDGDVLQLLEVVVSPGGAPAGS